MRKIDEALKPKSCFNRARQTEWLFVLLGRDVAAPAAIREWCRVRCQLGKNTPEDEQIREALSCAEAMEDERDAL